MECNCNLYVHTYEEFNDFRYWCVEKKPKIVKYFFDFDLSENDFCRKQRKWLEECRLACKHYYERFGSFTSKNKAARNLIEYYKTRDNYNCPLKQAKEEVEYWFELNSKTDKELLQNYIYEVMELPTKVLVSLKWFCPLPFIRKFLQECCGLKPHREWLYKLFWKHNN